MADEKVNWSKTASELKDPLPSKETEAESELRATLAELDQGLSNHPNPFAREEKKETKDLTDLEKKIQRWCERAGVPFLPVTTESGRVTNVKQSNTLNYLDGDTLTAMRLLDDFIHDHGYHHHCHLTRYDWILKYDPDEPYFESYRALVAAKVKLAQLDLDVGKKIQNKTKRDDVHHVMVQRERIWIKDMSKFL